jgi:hypothetical protein
VSICQNIRYLSEYAVNYKYTDATQGPHPKSARRTRPATKT